jgi:ATP-dependent exoDNAse (exonuclease V) beta subunit
MKILKASAGSGKTYQLSHTYIDLLLASREPHPYRHILAVTFTNKATAEMKSRILRDLAELAKTDPRARVLLTDMLHDYGAFAVSTNDRFFQQALRAFSREIGQFADYQVELDKPSLIAEAMDRILDSLTEDSGELLTWIRKSLSETLEQGRRYQVDEGLLEIGQLLKNDEFRKLAEQEGISGREAFGQERLKKVRSSCRKVMQDFCDRAAALGIEAKPGDKIKMLSPTKLAKASPEVRELFGDPYREYCTALILDGLLYRLGLAGEFYKAFDELVAEKNVMSLDDSNTVLRDIIAGSDAPFVYEKLGVRYEHFLLDEFQDTSRIQWDNFLPLLRESDGYDHENLIVGDVKQSIYRWRDSDWELLGGEVQRTFPRATVEPLQGNWRSTRTVIGFNNRFFTYAAAQLGLQENYADVRQDAMLQEAQEGEVRVDFCADQLGAVLQSIEDVRRNGAEWSDIAVLVRNKKEGAAIAAELIAHDIPVISDDSLNLKGSPAVRRLVSLLSCCENPADQLGRFLADEMGFELPETYHSLVDFSEELLRAMLAWNPAVLDGQVLFVQAFMDRLQEWVQVNGNNLRGFLKYWEEQEELYIGSPENAASVRVLTIHKSKGLEFPHVIFPFANKVDLYKGNVHWCRLSTERSPFDPEVAGIYPVNLTSLAETSRFDDAAERERRLQLMDNINVFYVALTRAGKSLHIIAAPPSGVCQKSLGKALPHYGNFAELLFHCLGGQESFRAGQPYDFRRMERKEERRELDFPAAYPSVPLGGRLTPSQDAHDFFGDDGTVGAESSPRLRGIVLHDILAEVRTPDELDAAVDAAVRDGRLEAAEGEAARRLLRERIAAHPAWFPATLDGVEICNEVDLFDTSGAVERPDRVILRGRQAVIVDYKFGAELPSYRRQLQRYARLWHELGYEIGGAYIWYVEEDKTVEAL